jgi:predicted MFS family arabinose efflux permease
VLAVATLLFGVAMVALGSTPWVIADASAGVAVFACAEMAFTPTVSTAFAALPVSSQLESFNLRQVSWTLGEALGAWCGGSVFLVLLDHGLARAYWLALGAATLAGMSLVMLTGRSARRPAEGR